MDIHAGGFFVDIWRVLADRVCGAGKLTREGKKMDPTAALKAFRDAIITGDTQDAAEALAGLDGWLNNGGFMPEIDRASLAALVTTAYLWVSHQDE